MNHSLTLNKRRFFQRLRVLLILGVIVGCGAAQPTNTSVPQTQTSVQLSWVHTIEFVGFYEAIRQQYYQEAGVEVRLDQGGFDSGGAYIDPVTQVVTGKSDFGVAGADVVLKARSEGKPVVAIATLYQRSPVALISLSESNITRPQDLIGKRIAVQPPNSTVGIAYEALLTSQNIQHADLQEIDRTDYNTVNVLFDKDVDVLLGFITNDGMKAQLRDDSVNFLLISDYGIDIYSNVIFTSEDTIKNRPQLVEAFVKATVRGIQWSVDNPEKAATHVIEQYGQAMAPDIKDTQKPGMLASVPLLKPLNGRPGDMKAEVWESAHQILLDQAIIPQPIDINAAYNLSFIEKAYQP